MGASARLARSTGRAGTVRGRSSPARQLIDAVAGREFGRGPIASSGWPWKACAARERLVWMARSRLAQRPARRLIAGCCNRTPRSRSPTTLCGRPRERQRGAAVGADNVLSSMAGGRRGRVIVYGHPDRRGGLRPARSALPDHLAGRRAVRSDPAGDRRSARRAARAAGPRPGGGRPSFARCLRRREPARPGARRLCRGRALLGTDSPGSVTCSTRDRRPGRLNAPAFRS